MADTKREKWIDLAKCIAILIVIMNHTTVRIPVVSFVGGMFFVPVFFMLSGYTCREREEDLSCFLRRKAKRLLLPYVGANVLLVAFFCVKELLTGTADMAVWGQRIFGFLYARNQLFAGENRTALLLPWRENIYFMTCLNSPTWFLPALFLTAVCFELLLRLTDRNGRKMCFCIAILLLLAIVYHYLFPMLLPWSLDAVPLFLILYACGYFMRRREVLAKLDGHIPAVGVLLLFFIVTAYLNGTTNFSIADYGNSMMLALCNAVLSSVLLLFFCYQCKNHVPRAAALIGRKTLFLLCAHLFVLSVCEALLAGLGLPEAVILLIALAILTVLCRILER
jgi:fucose 4-O-acetylase-like acetyltransferase